jgi:hypothetical protein
MSLRSLTAVREKTALAAAFLMAMEQGRGLARPVLADGPHRRAGAACTAPKHPPEDPPMEVLPQAAFPQQYDQIYYPGPQATHGAHYLLGLLAVVAGADFTVAPPPGSDPRYGATLFGIAMLALGVVVLVRTWTVRRRTAVALTAEGLYYRDWRNRVWHLPWGKLEQVTISTTFWRGRGGWYGLQPSRLGVQKEAVYLTGRFVPGGRTTVRVTARSRMVRHESDVQGDPMVAAIITRAGLVPGKGKEHEATWVRGR